jgi:L-lactate dehydrogenase complex protein LldG
MPDARASILSKIRQSLNLYQAPKPYPEADASEIGEVYADSGLNDEEQFVTQLKALGVKFIYCEHEIELMEQLVILYDAYSWKKMLTNLPLVQHLAKELNLDYIEPSDPLNTTADACITDCELLVARTGSIIISSRQHDGRVSTVFYPNHIVIATPDQLVHDIGNGLVKIQKKYGEELPSMINLNTGPSRTADIEKTLVVGVHGPAEVFLLYLNQNNHVLRRS